MSLAPSKPELPAFRPKHNKTSLRTRPWQPRMQPVAQARTFEELLNEGSSVPVEGWDFSWFEGRATEQRPSWGYSRLLIERVRLCRHGPRRSNWGR